MSQSPPNPAGEARQLLALVRELCAGFSLDKREVELAGHFVQVLGAHWPERKLAVRLLQGEPPRVKAAICSEAELQPQLVEAPLRLEESALAALSPRSAAALAGIATSVSYEPLLSPRTCGRSVALVQGSEPLALVNMEWDAAAPAQAEELELWDLGAELLAQALGNRRAAVDTRFFRGRLTRIIDQANALVFITDARHRVILFNRALAQLSGLRSEVVLGTDLLRWLSPADHRRFASAFERCLAGEWITGFELQLQDEEGQGLGRAVFNFSGLRDQEDRTDQVIAIGQDAASIKLLEKQVIQAEKLATLGRMAAGVMHEINNPLTSVTVHADYLLKKLRREQGDGADMGMLEKILEGADRILRCTRDLMDYAKPTEDRAAPLSLNDVVSQAIIFCQHALQAAGATVTTSLAADILPISGIQDQLQQLFVNLITNAAHATPAEGGEIAIRSFAGGDGTLAVEIRDCGDGIPADKLPRIFHPFFTTKSCGEGTGLGLSIVKKIVDHHQGSILVRSAVGQGTTFLIAFPPNPRRGQSI